jgi:hypothetical protein
VFDGANTAAILPVGGGKNLILNACAQAATQLSMKRSIIVEVSFFRTLIFAQLDEFGDETTYVTPVEVEYDREGSEFGALPACEANPATAPHVVSGAVGVGKNVIVTTPEFLVGDSGRSINARDDIVKFAGAGRLLAVFIDEGQTFKLQRELRAVAFAKFVQFLGLLHGTAGIAEELLSIVVTTGTVYLRNSFVLFSCPCPCPMLGFAACPHAIIDTRAVVASCKRYAAWVGAA